MTTLNVTNDQLLREVVDLGKHPSPEAAVDAALKEYRQTLKRKQLIDPLRVSDSSVESILAQAVSATGDADPEDLIALFGTIDYLPDYDPIAERRRQTAEFNKYLDELEESDEQP
jgi:hypothetical protein